MMLSDFVQSVTDLIENLVLTFGWPGITLVALFENLFPPTPSEYLYPLAGKMAYDGHISLPVVVLAGVGGSLIGSLIFYALGYQLGEERARRFIASYGRLRLARFSFTIFAVKDYDRGLALFARYGGRIVFVARLLPLVHGIISIPAGVVRMNLLHFLLYTAVGSALWITPSALLGYWLGSRWQEALLLLDIYQNVIYVLMAAALTVYIISRIRAARQQTAAEPTD